MTSDNIDHTKVPDQSHQEHQKKQAPQNSHGSRQERVRAKQQGRQKQQEQQEQQEQQDQQEQRQNAQHNTAESSRQRSEAEINAVFELHRLGLSLSAMVSAYAAESGMNGRDAEALLIIWQAQLSHASLTASQLASTLGITRAASTYMLDRLEQRGYLVRRPDPDDRRKTLVRLSSAGSDFGESFVKARAPHGTVDQPLFVGRSAAEVALFASMLHELNEAMDPRALKVMKASLRQSLHEE
ncbi:MAG: MarR family transcriptional regulator [Arcanobacterium sp.]|nr:MarR family transcriptional regulator [Arcanobacterium sp.]